MKEAADTKATGPSRRIRLLSGVIGGKITV